MNNNRGNNRRRGRGNGNNRPQGGGQQLNRIDSRARGNAPQLLEKYRKLAQDAHLNGDRVTAEYYLQFADHYFRVIADTRVRQEEQRQRREDRWQDQPEEGDDGTEFSVEGDFPAFDQPYTRREREEREGRDTGRDRDGNRDRDTGRERDSGREREAGRDREGRERDRDSRRRDNPRRDDARRDEAAQAELGRDDGREPVDAPVTADVAGNAEATVYEPAENPFVRENRGTRGLRPRRDDRRPRRAAADDADAEAPATIDASLLPPALSPRDEAPAPVAPVAAAPVAAADVEAEAAPAPKRRGRKPKAAVVEVEGEV